MKLLVTGGCGFIGSNFIRLLLNEQKTYEIVNVDALTYAGNPENIQDIADHSQYTFVHGRVEDEALVHAVFEKHHFDAVVHFAAESHVDRSLYFGAEFVRTNIVGTQTLLDAARKHQIKRFIQISTDEVYGSLPETGLFTEASPINPSSPYSASKAAADMLALAAFRTLGLPVIVTRSSNNYGPYQFPEKVIPLFISRVLKDESVPLYGDGKNIRDWIYVEDNCRAVLAVLEQGIPGEVYNIGGGNEVTNIELTKHILRLTEKPESLITYVKDRPAHDRRYALDSSKIDALMGKSHAMNFSTGLEKTVAWYQTHTAWSDRITSGAYQDFLKQHYGTKSS